MSPRPRRGLHLVDAYDVRRPVKPDVPPPPAPSWWRQDFLPVAFTFLIAGLVWWMWHG